MRRSYRDAVAGEDAGGFTVMLDGRPVQTPAKAVLTLPTWALAEAIAAEWQAQEEEIRPATMPLARLAQTAIDRVAPNREHTVAQILAYAGTDLVCHRAEGPPRLVARQEAAWGPLLDWLAGRHGVCLQVTSGIMPLDQPAAVGAAMGVALGTVAVAADDMMLAALHGLTTACGSVVIALALVEGRIDADEAWCLSLVDETFQAEQWGEDPEAALRRESLREDIASVARFMELCRP